MTLNIESPLKPGRTYDWDEQVLRKEIWWEDVSETAVYFQIYVADEFERVRYGNDFELTYKLVNTGKLNVFENKIKLNLSNFWNCEFNKPISTYSTQFYYNETIQTSSKITFVLWAEEPTVPIDSYVYNGDIFVSQSNIPTNKLLTSFVQVGKMDSYCNMADTTDDILIAYSYIDEADSITLNYGIDETINISLGSIPEFESLTQNIYYIPITDKLVNYEVILNTVVTDKTIKRDCGHYILFLNQKNRWDSIYFNGTYQESINNQVQYGYVGDTKVPVSFNSTLSYIYNTGLLVDQNKFWEFAKSNCFWKFYNFKKYGIFGYKNLNTNSWTNIINTGISFNTVKDNIYIDMDKYTCYGTKTSSSQSMEWVQPNYLNEPYRFVCEVSSTSLIDVYVNGIIRLNNVTGTRPIILTNLTNSDISIKIVAKNTVGTAISFHLTKVVISTIESDIVFEPARRQMYREFISLNDNSLTTMNKTHIGARNRILTFTSLLYENKSKLKYTPTFF